MNSYDKLKAIYDEIDVLIDKKVTCGDEEFIRWETKTTRFLQRYYGMGQELKAFKNTSFSLSLSALSTPHEDFVKACLRGLKETKATFSVYLEELAEEDDIVAENGAPKNKFDKSKIFIVHGHDGELKEKVARMIEKQGISAIILSEQANLGSTIIEKIEMNSDVGAAICLFTADDVCKMDNGILKNRARQNVVFEAGYFIAKLGRTNVVIIANKDIDMPSDLSGVVYSNHATWELEVLRELKGMGFRIDMNKAI